MPWQVVEKHDGYQVIQAPAMGDQPHKYFAKFPSKLVDWTPFRLTQQQARDEGQLVSDQIAERLQHRAAASWRARSAPEPHDNPSRPTGCAVQAPLMAASLWCVPGNHQHQGLQAQPQQLAVDSGGGSLTAHAGQAAAAAAAALQQQCQRVVAGAAGASAPTTGSLVRLAKCYHGGLPGSCIQLGSCMGSGGFADVHQGTVVPMNGLQLSNPQQYQQVVAAGAAEAARAGSLPVAVKVFRSSRSGLPPEALQKCVAQELEALRHLRFKREAVQLLAEGEPVPPPASAAAAAADSVPSHTSSQRKRKFGKDACSLQLPYCAVLELCVCSLQDVLRSRLCSEPEAAFVAAHVVELLDYCQSGKLGCIIVHRDLKPANILLRADGSFAVADFGACCIIKLPAAGAAQAAAAPAAAAPAPVAVEGGQQQLLLPAAAAPPVWPDPGIVATAAAAPIHTVIGTPLYLAPEVYGTAAAAAAPPDGEAAAATEAEAAAATEAPAHGDQGRDSDGNTSGSRRHSYDASVDVFALGVVVAEMLLGSLHALFEHGPPKSLAQVQQWEQRLQALVDGDMPLPEGVVLSSAALQFIGCCCGVGQERVAAATRGEPKRLTPAQLKKTAWLQQHG